MMRVLILILACLASVARSDEWRIVTWEKPFGIQYVGSSPSNTYFSVYRGMYLDGNRAAHSVPKSSYDAAYALIYCDRNAERPNGQNPIWDMTDAGPQHNAATVLSGTIGWTNLAGGSLVCNGAYMTFYGTNWLAVSNLTVWAWVYSTASGGSVIGGKYQSFPGCWEMFFDCGVSPHTAAMRVFNNGGDTRCDGTTASSTMVNGWHLILGTFDGATVTIWVDGKRENATSAPGLINGAPGQSCTIGGRAYPSAESFFSGYISEFGCVGKTWTGSTVTNYYNRTCLTYGRNPL